MGAAFPEGTDHGSVVAIDLKASVMETIVCQPHDSQLDHHSFHPANIAPLCVPAIYQLPGIPMGVYK